jgi:hypothetical protein
MEQQPLLSLQATAGLDPESFTFSQPTTAVQPYPVVACKNIYLIETR